MRPILVRYPSLKWPLVAAAILFFYSLSVMYTHFLAGSFGYSDVTLSNDFLGNWVYGKGFFYLSDLGYHHFKVHFTPTLILLSPFYLFFKSQFLLLFLGTLSFYGSFVVFLFVFEEIKLLSGKSPVYDSVTPLALLVLMALNFYTKTILLAANAWFLYALFFSLTVFFLVRGSRPWLLGGAALLALGVRQDTGFYFFFQILSLWFLPVTDWQRKRDLRKKISALAVLGIGYTLVCVFWIEPALGANLHIDRGWQLYGQSWPEIGATILTSPLRTARDFLHSGFLGINFSFGWLALLSPFSWIGNNLPGVLHYISDDISKRYLWYYTASFLLPGMFLATWLGFLKCKPKLRRFVLGGIFLGQFATLGYPTRSDDLKFIPSLKTQRSLPVRQTLAKIAQRCPGAQRIAADSRSVVYLPNDKTKFRLHHYDQADLVIFTDQMPDLPVNFLPAAALNLTLLHDKNFEPASLLSTNGIKVFIRKSLVCH